MGKRVFKSATYTPVAVADTTNFTNLGYMALQGGSTTQRTRIIEVNEGGQAAASAPTFNLLARDSTIGATLTALTTGESDGPFDTAMAALAAPVVPFTQSTTKPQRSASLASLNMSYNAFGGIYRWVAAPDEEFWMLGNAVNAGEVSLSCFTGGTPGLTGADLVYETL